MKKYFAIMMAMVMVFSLAACGGKTAAPAPSAAAPAAPASSAAAPADETNTYKVGSIGPLTGDAAIYGQAVINGVQIAVDEINASDSKTKFDYKYQDDVADGETSVNAYNKLMDDGMQLLVGPTTTGASIAVADICFNDRTFMLTPSASSVDVIADRDNVFQVCFTDPNQGTGAADYMVDNMADAKVAVIYRNDDAYSQGIRDTFIARANEKGMNVVYEGTFTADTATDFSVQLTAA